MNNYHIVLHWQTSANLNHLWVIEDYKVEVARVWLTNLTHHKALTAMRRVTHNFRQLGHTVITSESVNFHRLKNNNFRQFDVMDDEEMAMELLSR